MYVSVYMSVCVCVCVYMFLSSSLVSQGDPGSNTTPDSSFFTPPNLSHLEPLSHTKAFTSSSPLSNANPFLSLLQQNPFFQEIYVDAALAPNTSALTCFSSPVYSISLFGSPHHRECPVTEETSPDDVHGMALQPQEVTVMSNEGMHSNPFVSDMDWDQAIKPEDVSQAPLNTEPSVHANPQNTETDTNFDALTNTNPCNNQDPLQLSPNVSQTSLPRDFSMDFSEMHKLACPYPGALLDQMDTTGRSETCLNETSPSQMPLGSFSNSQLAGSTTTWLRQPDQSVEMSGVVPESTELESDISSFNIDLNGKEADVESVFSLFAAEVVTEAYTPSKEPRLSAYRDMSSDDTLEASTIVSYSPGRELDHHTSDPLPTWQEFNREQEIDDDKNKTGDAEVKVPVIDGSDLSDTDTTSKQEIGFRAVNKVFGLESLDPYVGSSVQELNRTDSQSVSSGNHILDHSLEAENPFSGSLVCIMASSPGETLISSESRFTGDSALLRGSELPSSPTRVLQDMSPDSKNLDTSLSTHELETHHKTLEDPVSLLASDNHGSTVNTNNSVNPFVSADSDAYVSPLVSVGPDESNSTSNPFFSLNSDSVCASSHNSGTSPNKDLLLAPQSTRVLGSLLYESAESECYHSCTSLHRNASFTSHRLLPLTTAKDPLEQLIASYDLAVKTQPPKDPSQNSMQITDPNLNLSPLSSLTSNLQMNSPVLRDASSPASLPTYCVTQEVVPNQKSSQLLQKDNFAENFANPFPEDPFPDIVWMSNLKDKAVSEQWPSLPSMLACDQTAKSMPNYEFMEGVVPNSDLTQNDMPKSVPLQEVPATKDIEMNPFVGGVDMFPKDSVSGSPFTGESEVQGFSEFAADWANFDKFAAVSSSGENKEVVPEAGASLLNEDWASSSWLTPVTSKDQNDLPWVAFDQSLPDQSVGVSDGTPPSSSITQDLVISHFDPQCPQTDSHTNLKSNQGQLDLFGEHLQVFPEVTSNSTGMKTDLKLTFKPDLASLSPLASSTPAADPSSLSFPAVAPSCPSPMTTASDLIGASQTIFSQEHQQPSNHIFR